MKIFSVPYNGDLNLIRRLSSDEVKEVYGRPTTVGIGGARASRTLRYGISRKNIKEAVKLCRSKGIKFNYVANSPLIDRNKCDSKIYHVINEELEWVKELSVNGIIVSRPYLAGLALKKGIRVIVSKLARVDNIEKVRKWVDKGVIQICLDLNIIRNLKLLKEIKKNAGNCNLQLLVNDSCLFHCPMDNLHAKASSIASKPNKKYNHYYSYTCIGKHFLRKPQEFIRAAYIRPEDLKVYRSIGFDNFKIVDRNRPTDWILKILDAYSKQKYNGNLADLFSLFGVDKTMEITKKDKIMINCSIEDVCALRKNIPLIMGVYINNNLLDGVLKHMSEVKCNPRNCDKNCKYCLVVAKKAMKIKNKENTRIVLDKVFEFLNGKKQSVKDINSINAKSIGRINNANLYYQGL
jgi:collagenase-like PrtC family protease